MNLLLKFWRWLIAPLMATLHATPTTIVHGDRCWDILPCACAHAHGRAVKWATVSGKWVLRCYWCDYTTHRYRRVGAAVCCWNHRQRTVAEQNERDNHGLG